MRVIPPPMTAREISTMLVATSEKRIGELELRLGRRLGAGYTKVQRRRDRETLALCHETIDRERRFLAALDQAERTAHRAQVRVARLQARRAA